VIGKLVDAEVNMVASMLVGLSSRRYTAPWNRSGRR